MLSYFSADFITNSIPGMVNKPDRITIGSDSQSSIGATETTRRALKLYFRNRVASSGMTM